MCEQESSRHNRVSNLGIYDRGIYASLPCKHCGNMMPPQPPSRRKTFCSGSCRNRDRSTLPDSTCIECLVTFKRRLGGSDIRNDREPKYCSVECKLIKQRRVAEEVSAIGRIGVKARSWARNYARLQKPPAVVMRDCNHCGCSYERVKGGSRYCSDSCRETAKKSAQAKSRKDFRQSEHGRASRRIEKSKRRALIKRQGQIDDIDPIKVFERDRWICHLCGIKTLKGKRGTIHTRAPELEHIISLADGGSHTWGNVACSCSACNRSKGARSFGQLGLGFSV